MTYIFVSVSKYGNGKVDVPFKPCCDPNFWAPQMVIKRIIPYKEEWIFVAIGDHQRSSA